MIDRPSLERRLKTVLERGAEAETKSLEGKVPLRPQLTCADLGLALGDVVEASQDVDVVLKMLYVTSAESGTAKLQRGDRLRLSEPPDSSASEVFLEPADYVGFEKRWVPGGVRGHEAYQGYGLILSCMQLARSFVTVPYIHSEPLPRTIPME